ncbi:hypothetical protein LQZ19_18205 [Treponema primitia]|uniref:hypothetical protein n=1 Tax=Treponema primitia TaxID=88058 RepID=UPI00397F274D
MKHVYTLMILILLSAAPYCFSADFGLTLGAAPEYGNAGQNTDSSGDFSFTGYVSPWIFGTLREGLSYYVSGRVTLEYEDDEVTTPLLGELERTELDWRPLPAVFVSAGRQYFADPAALIASGLFDGVNGSLTLGKTRLQAGVFYTGLLYKESAKIIMSAGDIAHYAKPLDYGDTESYFASRRLLTAISGEFPDLTSRTSLTLSGLAQFDLNAYDSDTVQSQYFLGQYSFTPVDVLTLNLAAAVGFTEAEGADLRTGFSAQAGAGWEPPGSLRDLAELRIRWSSGAVNDTVGPFLPVSGISQGELFTPGVSALLSLKAAYTARLHEKVSATAQAVYFIRTDTETYADADIDPESSSHLLGGEVYGSLIWAFDSTTRFTVGGGAFLPQLGGVFKTDAPVRWKASAGIIVSL